MVIYNGCESIGSGNGIVMVIWNHCTSVSFHLILSMQYHLTRRARSRGVRSLDGIVPFAFSRVAFRARLAITPTHPQGKMKRSITSSRHLTFAGVRQPAVWQYEVPWRATSGGSSLLCPRRLHISSNHSQKWDTREPEAATDSIFIYHVMHICPW